MSMTYYVQSQSQTITNIPRINLIFKIYYILNTGFANKIISLESKVFAVTLHVRG